MSRFDRAGLTPVTPEEELMLLLCARATHRAAASERIVALAQRSDLRALTALLERSLLLPLVGSRLLELAPHATSEEFAERVSVAIRRNRQRALLQETVASAMLAALEETGIAAVSLKGAPLAQAIYGDPGLRFAADIDLLVDSADLPEALAVLRRHGYGPSVDLPWEDGLPVLHHALPPERPGLPPLELHWRIHWNETRFSHDMLERSVSVPGGGRVLRDEDELAALLLFYARDSFFGLKLAADVAAWWDAKADGLAPAALDPILAAHPELRGPIGAALLVTGRLVGLPSERLCSERWPLDDSGRAAARLANWRASGEPDQQVANLTAVDWLLTPPGRRRSFLRRYMFQPAAAIADTYGRSPDARLRNELWRVVHGASRAAKFAYRYAAIRYAIRRGRTWSGPLPAPAVERRPAASEQQLKHPPLQGAHEPQAPSGL